MVDLRQRTEHLIQKRSCSQTCSRTGIVTDCDLCESFGHLRHLHCKSHLQIWILTRIDFVEGCLHQNLQAVEGWDNHAVSLTVPVTVVANSLAFLLVGKRKDHTPASPYA